MRNSMFKFDIRQLFPNPYCIYTDGSKDDNNTGCAIFDAHTNYYKKIKLQPNFSIFSAEMIAIIEALQYSLTVEEQDILIITDSKSSLEKLKNLNYKSSTNYLINNVVILMKNLQDVSKSVKLVWVKGHCNIVNNEIVDRLAKESLLNKNVETYLYPQEDIVPVIKRIYLNEWENVYQQEIKGTYYKSIQPTIPKSPWFKNSKFNKNYVKNICRLRFNHVLVPTYLHKIKFKDNPHCNCGRLGDAEHILLNCELKSDIIKEFVDKIYKLKICMPFNLSQLLGSRNLEVYKILCDHINKLGIKL